MTRRRNKRQPSLIDQAVGENIQRLRLAKSLSLADLAVRLGISHQQLHKYETGSNRACASMVYYLSRALDVPVISLFDGVPGIADFEPLAAELATARKRCKDIVDTTSSLSRLHEMSKVPSVLKDESGADRAII